MSRYIPMPAYYDFMPVDISFVFEDEKPAGKHGFLNAVGEEFVFEDGTPAKFWGVNINGAANFPEHDYAERFARRLAQAGCNIVRLQQMDAEWYSPNIFSFTKGKRMTTRTLDPLSLERLDYLIYCLKEQGIYCYLDMHFYRKFKSTDGVVDAELLSDVGKPYNMINRHLIDLQKEYATNLWTHYNPYTKLHYKDDPVFVMTDIINECDLFTRGVEGTWWYTLPEYYDREYRHMFKDWLDKNCLEYDWANCDMFTNDETLVAFKTEVTERFLTEMRDHIRSLGVKCPIAGTNWNAPTHALAKAHLGMDYTDMHPYYNPDNWTTSSWFPTDRVAQSKNISSTRGLFGYHAKMALVGKPLFISEWDVTWPNNYRAEGPIFYSAVGALQGWCGACIHTYAYSSLMPYMNILGQELSTPVAGRAYREGIYTVWNDPAKFGLFYHAALITRRGDVSPANKRIAVRPSDPTMVKAPIKPFADGLEQHRVRMYFGDEMPEGYDEMVFDTEAIPHPDPKIIMSDNGQMWRDPAKEIGAVDTERTKCFYGMLGKGFADGSVKPYHRPVHKMNGFVIECATDFGVIALSSLSNDPIETSDNILLSAIGRARNSGAQFDGNKMLDVGHAPIMAEVIDSIVRIKNIHGTAMKVWGVNAEGFYSGMLPTTYEGGWLSFRIGDENNPACYYLIVKE